MRSEHTNYIPNCIVPPQFAHNAELRNLFASCPKTRTASLSKDILCECRDWMAQVYSSSDRPGIYFTAQSEIPLSQQHHRGIPLNGQRGFQENVCSGFPFSGKEYSYRRGSGNCIWYQPEMYGGRAAYTPHRSYYYSFAEALVFLTASALIVGGIVKIVQVVSRQKEEPREKTDQKTNLNGRRTFVLLTGAALLLALGSIEMPRLFR